MNPQNIHPGTTSTGGDPSDFVSSHISPTKDTDGFSLGELGSRIRALKGIHMAAMRDAVSNPDAEQSSVDFATIREHALALLAMVGLGEGGDSKPRRLAHDAHRRASITGGTPPAAIFAGLKNIGAPMGDNTVKAGPASITGGIPVWAGLQRFGR